MLGIGIILTLSCFFIFVLSKQLFGRYFSPLGIYNFVWGLSFMLLSITTLSEHPLHGRIWLAIYITWGSFNLGSITTGFAVNSYSIKDDGFIRKKGKKGVNFCKIYKWSMTILSVLAIYGASRFLYIVLQKVGIATWLSTPQFVRHFLTQGEFDTGILTYGFRGINMSAASMGGAYIKRNYKYLPAYFGVFAAALTDLIFLGRSHTIIVLGIFLSSIYFSYICESRVSNSCLKKLLPNMKSTEKKSSVFIILIIFVVFILPFAKISSIRNSPGKYVNNILNPLMPYVINLSQNWYAAENIIIHDDSFTSGANTFFLPKFILYKSGLINRDPRNDRLYNESTETAYGNETNTYTMVGVIYKDYGYFGLVLIPYIFGLLFSYIFLSYIRSPSFYGLFFLSFIPPYLFFTVQGDQLSSPNFNIGFILSLLMGVFLQQMCNKRKPSSSYI